ncbi:MAG: YetF domain-containing protein [Nonlabens sp.]
MDWIYKMDDPIWQTLVGSFLIFISIVVLTRIVGLRSFAKFTAYDFAFTVAIGSIISSTLTSSTSIVHGVTAIGGLLIITFVFSTLQKKIKPLDDAISNKPLLLMKGNEILEKNLAHGRINKSQLLAKLREANVLHYDQVCAVVLESTGDISVLHKSSKDADDTLMDEILDGVRSTP